MDSNYFSNLSFPCPREAQNEIWATLAQWLQRSCLKYSTFFPYTCIGKHTSPLRKKVKCKCMTIILAILVDLPSPMISAKIQPQGILRSGEEDFLRFLPYMGMAAILVNATILAIFHFPAPGRLQMKFEQHWPRGSRGGHLKFSTFFPIQMHREANLTLP